MKASHLLFGFALLLFVACNSNTGSENKTKDSYEKTKTTLREKEQENPVMFLKIKGKNRKNLIGQTVVKGEITNSATLAQYKDVVVQLKFYSKTQTLLETDQETVYIEIKPGTSENFKSKYFAPKGTDSVALAILDAKNMQ